MRVNPARAPVPSNLCPVCHCDSFVLNGDRATCPICGRQATVEKAEDGLRLCFEAAATAGRVEETPHRWTPQGMRAHMIDWVMTTGPRFLAHRREIKARRKPFGEIDVDWLHPPPSETQ